MISLIVLLGVAMLFWPSSKNSKSVYDLTSVPAAPPTVRAVAFQEAIAALAVVRRRLEATEHLSDEEESAIDSITLALVRGSGDE